MKKRAIKFPQSVFGDLILLCYMGNMSETRSQIISCRLSHPAIFSTNKGRQIVDTTSQNPLYEVSAFVLFLLSQ